MDPQATDPPFNDLDCRRDGSKLHFTAVTAISGSEEDFPSSVYLQAMATFDRLKMALWNQGARLQDISNCTAILASMDSESIREFGDAFRDTFGVRSLEVAVVPAEGSLPAGALIAMDITATLATLPPITRLDPNLRRGPVPITPWWIPKQEHR